MEEDLVLVEVEVSTFKQSPTSEADYEYVRDMIIEGMKNE